MSEISGQVPDPNLSTELFEIIGRLRRNANTAARYGQADELQRIADQVIRWQIQLRKYIVLALGHGEMTDSWGTIVNQVAELRRERDGAQLLHKLAVEQIEELTGIKEANGK